MPTTRPLRKPLAAVAARLNSHDRRLAARYVDAYLWFGRPWLYNQAAPFVLDRALTLARTTPY